MRANSAGEGHHRGEGSPDGDGHHDGEGHDQEDADADGETGERHAPSLTD